mmetsp:Transcript_26380/g.56563  ORF Transcript_26380/g.56563 Transcript_26380/m.56563 type:complete len:440 (-) Transcript_26380:675-1994(-)
MIDKDGNQRIEKVFFDVVQQPVCIVQEVSVLEQRIGASGRGVTRVEALAPWLRRAVYPNGAVITDPPTRTIEGTKKIRTRGTQSGTDQGLGKCTGAHANVQLLKVVLADQPFSSHVYSQDHLVLDARRSVAPAVSPVRGDALAVPTVHLAVDVERIGVPDVRARQLFRLEAPVGASKERAVVGLARAAHRDLVLEVLEADFRQGLGLDVKVVDNGAGQLVGQRRGATALRGVVAEISLGVVGKRRRSVRVVFEDAPSVDKVATGAQAPGIHPPLGVICTVPAGIFEEGERHVAHNVRGGTDHPAERFRVVIVLVPVIPRARIRPGRLVLQFRSGQRLAVELVPGHGADFRGDNGGISLAVAPLVELHGVLTGQDEGSLDVVDAGHRPRFERAGRSFLAGFGVPIKAVGIRRVAQDVGDLVLQNIDVVLYNGIARGPVLV